MAQKVQTIFIDDIDGCEADGTVRFGLGGADCEIDLSDAHSEELRKTLAAYIEHGRKIAGARRRAVRSTARGNSGGVDTAKVREWAKAQGIEVKDRGRVPSGIIEKYNAAGGR